MLGLKGSEEVVLMLCSTSAVPFNVEELNAVLRFGAEDLFSKDEEEDEAELQVWQGGAGVWMAFFY